MIPRNSLAFLTWGFGGCMWKLHGGRKVKINQLIDLATTFVQIPTHTHKVIVKAMHASKCK